MLFRGTANIKPSEACRNTICICLIPSDCIVLLANGVGLGSLVVCRSCGFLRGAAPSIRFPYQINHDLGRPRTHAERQQICRCTPLPHLLLYHGAALTASPGVPASLLACADCSVQHQGRSMTSHQPPALTTLTLSWVSQRVSCSVRSPCLQLMQGMPRPHIGAGYMLLQLPFIPAETLPRTHVCPPANPSLPSCIFRRAAGPRQAAGALVAA